MPRCWSTTDSSRPVTSPAPGVAHILTNAIGGSTEKVDVDVDLLRLEDGDRVLLCSDGLTDLVDDDEIADTLAAMKSSKDACAELMRQALDGGGRDNITVIVARLHAARRARAAGTGVTVSVG